MMLYYQKAIQDLLGNRFLNTVTVITIALSILIVSAFALFIVNANDIMLSWEKGIRIMAYLKPGTSEAKILDLQQKIKAMDGVADIRFIPKKEGLSLFEKQMKRQASLLRDLKENPLPDAFEIRMTASSSLFEKIEILSSRIESLPPVDEVEYGQRWLGRFVNIVNLFRFTAYAMGTLFFMATVFIVANTIRLVLYSRREEVEIMRLVGASDSFIKAPFYIEGLIYGALGGILGLAALFITFMLISSNVEQDFATGFFQIRFLPPGVFFAIVACSMFVGWLGCYLSLKQFLK